MLRGQETGNRSQSGGVSVAAIGRRWSVVKEWDRNVSRIANYALVAFLVIGVVACAHPAADPDGRAIVRRIPGPAGTLVVDDGGRGGVPVVFLHSYAGSRAHWSHQLAHLRKTRRAIAIDLRGHGESSAPANRVYSSTALAADVAAVVDALRLDRFVLVGHSMGGSAAIAYAGVNPQ